MYLAQYSTQFGDARSLMNKIFWDARAKGRIPDAKMLFADFSL